MDNTTRQLLDELYQIEPTLESKEKAIVPMIERMLENKPDIKLDTKFKNKLRNEIMKTFAEKEQKPLFAFIWNSNFYSGL